MKALRHRLAMACIVLLVVLAATATSHADMGFVGWGPRFGISDDPDQGIIGAHFDLGEFADNVRFRPSVEIGFGDDVTSFLANGLVAYYFDTQASVTPFAGAQAAVAFFDPDDADSETEIGIDVVGGIEIPMKGSTRFLTELQIGFGDIHDFKLMVGWTF
jgi:hypothetical protein